MRTFNFKARNIGEEKYLTYTMGEGCELDEDVLDYCEENNLKELIDIIYEEDDDYDYLTYDITEKTALEDIIKKEVSCKQVLYILRNVANGLISLKEQAIPLSYVLLNRNFMYIDVKSCDLFFICLPIEAKGSVMAEFKGFMRQLLANMKYDVDEDLGYVGKLLTYINGDNFNLRGLIGLTEALMEEAGIDFEEAGAIEADGVEVVNSVEEPEIKSGTTDNLTSFMNDLPQEDEALPEIGDDEDTADEDDSVMADEELDSILPAGMNTASSEDEEDTEAATEEASEDNITEADTVETAATEETAADENKADEAAEMDEAEDVTAQVNEQKDSSEAAEKIPEQPAEPENADNNKKETDINLIKNRIKELVGDVPSAKPVGVTGKSINTIEDLDELLESKPPVIKRNVVKVNRAAIIQNVAAEEEAAEQQNNESEGQVPVIEDIYEDMNIEKDEKPKSKSILSKSVDLLTKPLGNSDSSKTANNTASAPKAMPYLIRVNTEERIMLNKVNFKLGKASMGVDYTVSGNGAISRQHAVIIQRDGVCYIKDNKSTNHTYVNGKMVEDGAEEILTHDSMIKLGDEEFIFKIR